MKTLPAPDIPGNTDWERFDNALRKIIAVPKEAILKEDARWKRARARKRAKNKAA